MTKPRDKEFNELVLSLVLNDGPATSHRIYFIDKSNHIREVAWAADIESGGLRDIEQRLRSEGELKAIVHVGMRKVGRSESETYIEYLPDDQIYVTYQRVVGPTWDTNISQDEAREHWNQYHMEGGEEET